MKPNPLLLIVDDEKHTREGLAQVFAEEFEVFTASQPEEAFRLMRTEVFDVILTDLRMGSQSGLSVIDQALQLPNRPICILMTAYGTIEIAVEAMKHGAYDFISKPIALEKLECMVARAMADRKQVLDHRNLSSELPLLGKSLAFQKLMQQISRVAPTKTTVLITGETGTGKELVAHQLHALSLRSKEKWVPVHCAAFPAHLLESELFGHERGAFTGALQRHIGWFETAHKGTLFLDEIGEIDRSVQVKLLRFLETKSIERLGSTQSIPLDVRLIGATNRHLPTEVQAGRFREDLYYRLNVVELVVPPLRERIEDIGLLLHHYLQVFSKENHVVTPELTDEVLLALQRYIWPGNVRELRNFAENMVVLHRARAIRLEDLDPKFLSPVTTTLSEPNVSEKEDLQKALLQAKGKKTEAARLLGMPRRTFYRKLEKWKLL